MGGQLAIRVSALLALVGCRAMLELEPPLLRPDANESARADAAVDGAPDVRQCPAAPAGCTLFECAGSSSCYYACNGPASWGVAQNYCMQVGCLATIESQAEQDCITAATNPTNASPLWFGAYQLDPANEPKQGWTWACDASSYTAWGSFEPNDLAGDQDCGELTNGGYWNDVACTLDRRFVCELP
ncbi:MAG TPA: C-type lectin domain-containing protein [Kofleriaceae bacterium]